MKTSIFPFFFLDDVAALLEKSFSLPKRFGKDLYSMCWSCCSGGVFQGDEFLLHAEIFFKLADGHLSSI